MNHLKRITLFSLLLVGLPLLTSFTSAQSSSSELAGWANVPGGQVWLRPGLDAYEHSTGLVRDLTTGQKSRPITPNSVPQAPQVVLTPAYPSQPIVVTPQPIYAPSPVYAPQPIYAPSAPNCPNCRNYPANPYYAPQYPSRYDVGPYGNSPNQNYGFQSGAPQRPLRDTYSRIK